jgi:hypothetical protein
MSGYNSLMQKIWFKSKAFGWGWTPATWQGWTVTALYAGLIGLSSLLFLRTKPSTGGWIGYFTSIALATACLILICYKTGEKPSWRWGHREK